MKVSGEHFRTIWLNEKNHEVISIIDQRFLPHRFVIEELHNVNDIYHAIREMQVRGAGLIGAAAGYGMYIAALEARTKMSVEQHMEACANKLISARPTAVNLSWAVNRQLETIARCSTMEEMILKTKQTAMDIADEDAKFCRSIGKHGVKLIEKISKKKKGGIVNILTHCNAGWLAFVDYGSATAPIYEAAKKGIQVHVWVDETRPRNQGGGLTAWELLEQGIPHTVITDNTGGHLMQHGLVDMVITGADRVTKSGDAANKIGTYLKALAARDNDIPFYIALPSSTFDWNISDGLKEIEIEERSGDEVKYISGMSDEGIKKILVTPSLSPAANYGFDVTPSRLITGLITEKGICKAKERNIAKLFPRKK